MIIDTHCHVYKSEMENAEEIIKQALNNDIHLILNGTDFKSNMEVLELADKYENVHAALGYFYTLADDITNDDIALLDRQLENNNVVAVGEIGLDYYYTKDNKDRQIELFERMLDLAEKHDLPVIVHSRKAIQDTFDVLKRHEVVGSLHCYQGSAEMARRFLELGFYIGVGGPVTLTNNKKTRKMVKTIDINHMIVETDSPYLPPQEKRGEINTPQNIKYVIRKIAEYLEMDEDDIIEITSQNAKKLFKLDI